MNVYNMIVNVTDTWDKIIWIHDLYAKDDTASYYIDKISLIYRLKSTWYSYFQRTTNVHVVYKGNMKPYIHRDNMVLLSKKYMNLRYWLLLLYWTLHKERMSNTNFHKNEKGQKTLLTIVEW